MTSFQPVRIAYNAYDPHSGVDENLSPLIFLHGLTSFKEYWRDIPQIIANATRRKAYAIDARNHGDSEWTDVFNFDVNADDLIHFMDTAGIRKAILIGQSMGGITAITTALRWPERIEKIVVEDMYVRKVDQQTINQILTFITLAQNALKALPDGLDEEGAKKFLLNFIFSSVPSSMSQTIKEEDQMDTSRIQLKRDSNGRFTSKTNYEAIEKALRNPETVMSDPKGLYEGPAFFIYGKLSPFLVGADTHHVKKFFPNATFEGIEDATHDVHTDKPLEFTDAILKFLSS